MQMHQYIEQALLSSRDMLTVLEFIKETKYPIDTFMITRFWNTIEGGMLIYVDDELIKWMGYVGAERKQSFAKLLASSKSSCDKDYFRYSNDEYDNFLTGLAVSITYPQVDRGNGKSTTKHLLLTPRCFKTTIMKLTTARGDRVREYFCDLEQLVITYVKYQCEYAKKTYQDELNKIIETNRIYTRQRAIEEFDTEIDVKYSIQCVYFIRSGEYIKIGYTSDLPKRLSNLQTGNPHQLTVIHTILTRQAEEIEADLHKMFAEYHVSGEWFRLPDDAITRVKELYE